MPILTILKAAEMGMAALDMAQGLLSKAQTAGKIVAKAQSEGRTTLTDDEVKELQAADDAARQRLVDAINNAEE